MPDSGAPSGGRRPTAFRLTDIEASTRPSEADPRAMEVDLHEQ